MDTAVFDAQSLTNSSSSNPRTPSPLLPPADLQFAYSMPDPAFDHRESHYWPGSAPSTADPKAAAAAAAAQNNHNGNAFLSEYIHDSPAAQHQHQPSAPSQPHSNQGPHDEQQPPAQQQPLYGSYPPTNNYRADWALSGPTQDLSPHPGPSNTPPSSSTPPLHQQHPSSASPLPAHLSAPDAPHPALYRRPSYGSFADHQSHHHHQQQQHQQHPALAHQQPPSHHPALLHQPPHSHHHPHQQHPHHQQQQQHPHHQQPQHHPSLMQQYSQDPTPRYMYQDQMPPHAANPSALHGHHDDQQPFSVLPPPADYDHDSVKLEHTSSMVVPSQLNHHAHHPYYRPSSSSSSISNVSAPPSYIPPSISSIPIMHTDDAASKETQYLRRKCFNCQTTEPPSWRRSTLNPGKIVCNKCGLYERTHNKPRPHQFGLRPGNKARKQAKSQTSPTMEPSTRGHGISVKKEAFDAYGHPIRRASLNGQEWEDGHANGVYGSNPGAMAPPHPHHHHPYAVPHRPHYPQASQQQQLMSHAPPSIRIPQAPPMKTSSPSSLISSSSAPGTPYGSLPPTAVYGHQLRPDYFPPRRGSVGGPGPDLNGGIGPVRRHTVAAPLAGTNGISPLSMHGDMASWQQSVPLSEMSVTPAPALAGIASAGSTPRKVGGLHGTSTPPPITTTSVVGSPALSAGSGGAAPPSAVAPSETDRSTVTA